MRWCACPRNLTGPGFNRIHPLPLPLRKSLCVGLLLLWLLAIPLSKKLGGNQRWRNTGKLLCWTTCGSSRYASVMNFKTSRAEYSEESQSMLLKQHRVRRLLGVVQIWPCKSLFVDLLPPGSSGPPEGSIDLQGLSTVTISVDLSCRFNTTCVYIYIYHLFSHIINW